MAFRGELFAYRALLAAAQGDIEASAHFTEESRSCTQFGEPVALTLLAQAVVNAQNGREVGIAPVLSNLMTADMRDPLVTAYRLYPSLIEIGIEDRSLARALTETLNRSRDYDLAKLVGLEIRREQRPREQLSAREREVCELLAQGRGNRDIAKALFISESTAKVHVHHIFEKLGVRTRAEAARLFVLDRDG
jgi:DNA-binding NarL/FixJ family response regulator